MKRVPVWVWIITALIVVGGFFGERYMSNKEQQEMMVKVAESSEAKSIYEQELKELDSTAFTENGIIKEYSIEKSSINHNQMGGINVKVTINNDSKLYALFILDKDKNGKLVDDGAGYSSKLDTLLKTGAQK